MKFALDQKSSGPRLLEFGPNRRTAGEEELRMLLVGYILVQIRTVNFMDPHPHPDVREISS